MKWTLLFLFIFIGCNSEKPDLSPIQGIADPNNPKVIQVSGPAATIYVLNDILDFSVTFSEPVEVQGLPLLQLSFDSGIETAEYVGGSGTNTLYFRKTIEAGEYETSGVEVSGKLIANGGLIRSFIDQNPAFMTFDAVFLDGVKVNAILTAFQTLTGPADGLYKANDNLCFNISYNAPVTITSSLIKLRFTSGGNTYQAAYVSGNNTTDLRFCYTVPTTVMSSGILINPNLIDGALTDAFGSAVSTVIVGNFPLLEMDGIAPTISSIVAPADGVYYANEELLFSITFTEPVSVVGSPRLSLKIGSADRFAEVISGSGTDTLTFKYTVQSGTVDSNGITVSSTIDIPSDANINDIAGNSLNQIPFPWPSFANVKIDGLLPVKTLHTINAPPIARKNDTLNIFMYFNETIHMTGTPKIALNIGGVTKYATLATSTPDSVLVFNYDVEPELRDLDGIEVLPGITDGTLKDGPSASANDVSFTAFSFPTTKVDSYTYIVSADIISDSEIAGQPEGSYKPGKTLQLQLSFSEAVTVTGAPRIDYDLDGTTKSLYYFGGTGTNTLIFTYNTGLGDIDLDGIDINSVITLNGGTIKDSDSIDVSLTLPANFNPSIYFIPNELDYWMDVSDPLSANLMYPNVTAISSKAEYMPPVFSAPFPTLEDDGVFVGAHFNDQATYYEYPNIALTYLIVVYRAPPIYTPSNKAFTFGTYSFEFMLDGRIRTECLLCKHYNGMSWLPAESIIINTYLGGNYSWTPSETRIVSLYIPFGTYNLKLGDQFLDGEIAEVITLSSFPGNAEMHKIHQYLKNKHQVDF